MFSKLFNRDSNKKSIRIKADVGNDTEKYISIQLTQSFDFLEFLSLKLSQKDVYRLFDSDYGVVAGRVIGNEGIGLPNCKVSIFIPIDEEDASLAEKTPTSVEEVVKKFGASTYPYKNVSDENNDGIRYNLLPSHKRNRWFNGFPANIFGIGATPKTPVGTFPDKEEVLVNPSFMHVYEKYYKYTTVTNDAGDFMLFGVPTGNHVLHMDCDLTDIGRWSISPLLMNKVLGYPDGLFSNEGSTIEPSTDLSTLPNIQSQNIPIFVKPLWSQNNRSTEVGISRQDFKVSGEIVPHFNFFTNGFRQAEDTYIGDRIIFRFVVKNGRQWKIKIKYVITFCLNFPNFSDSEFFSNKECQMCGGKLDLPPVTLEWTWRPFDCDTSTMTDNSPAYVKKFNEYAANDVKVSSVTDFDSTYKFKTWIGSETATNQTFIEKINFNRANNGLQPISKLIKLGELGNTGVEREESAYATVLKDICEGRETDETINIVELFGGGSGSENSEITLPSSVPSNWTSKFDLANARTDTMRAKLFTYKNIPELTNQSILGKSSIIDIENHIRLVRSNEYVGYEGKGVYLAQIPCNRTRVVTTEDGRIVQTDDLNKGVFSEFAGYFIFSMDGESENPPSRMRTGRVSIKVPQTTSVYTKSGSNEQPNPNWIKESHIFKAGELYSASQYLFTLSNNSYEDKIGFIARTNEIGTPMVSRNGRDLVVYGFPYNNKYTETTPSGEKADITTFENDWLNFSLYFLQFMYKTRSSGAKNFVCGSIISNKHKQLSDNKDSLGGGESNTKWLVDGSKFKTKVVNVNKVDFVRMFTKKDSGFSTDGGIDLEEETSNQYAKNPNSEKITFYKGFFSDSIKSLVDKELV
jgi:hypothetical protein